jgi:hypothetical protein
MNVLQAAAICSIPGGAIVTGGIGWAAGASWAVPVLLSGVGLYVLVATSLFVLALAGRREQRKFEPIYELIDDRLRK